MSWEGILGHHHQRELLRRSLQAQRLGHTLLFLGPAGIGKKLFALKFAQSLFCQKHAESDLEACDACHGCQQVLAGTHPDLFVVGCPEGKREIPIEVFLGPPERRGKAGLCYDLSHTPLAGQRKIAIIDDADLLNDASANALLKTLEEPPAHSLIILIASQSDNLLPTIRSRCQMLRFQPLSVTQIEELIERSGISHDPAATAMAAALSDGSLATAEMLLDPELRKRRESLFDDLTRHPFNSLHLAAQMQACVEALDSEAAGQRRAASWLLRFCIEFFRSVLWHGLSGKVIDSLEIPQAAKFLERCGTLHMEQVDQLEGIIQRALDALDHLDQNVGVALCLEAYCDDLGKHLRQLAA